MPDDYGNDTHKDRAEAWFASSAMICAALEAVELNVEGPNPSSEGEAGTFERKSWERPASDGAADAGGRCHVGSARPGLREGRRQRLRRLGRVFLRSFAKTSRVRPRTHVLGVGYLRGHPSAFAAGAGSAHEYPDDRDHSRVVWRRRGPDAGFPGRGRDEEIPSSLQRACDSTTRITTQSLRSGATSTSSCRIGTRRGASAASSMTTSTLATGKPTSPSPRMWVEPSWRSIRS